MSVKDVDPYKKVWNSVEDHESDITEWVKNGTLFVPTWEELARRHMSKARHLLAKARSAGRTVEGISIFNEAILQREMAQKCLDHHHEIMVKSR
jgi:hypothetical protein